MAGILDDGGDTRATTTSFGFLRSVPILYEVDDDTLRELAEVAEPCSFDPGERIVAQGEDNDARRFYVIRSGSADVLRRDRAGVERVVARLTLGSYFGELGLLTNGARNATVQVHGDLPLRALSFDALSFHRRIAEHVLVFRLLRERDRMRGDAAASGASSSPRPRLRIKELDLLRRLPPHDLEYVLSRAEQRWYPERAPIVQQGDAGDRFYVLLDGEVEVLRDGERIASLGPGDFFGETALLLDAPRSATVRVSRHALTWSITRSAFQRLVGGYLLSNPQLQAEVLRRMRSAQ
ncbi:MAG: cyclic nucleotide-binding protein [Thermoleophilia bacterium]|nr:cyclic nucleotide-binding protein [Thermoleophilia bacterium]